MQRRNETKDTGYASSLLLLTVFFFLLEVSFFVQCNQAYLDDFNFVSKKIHLPWILLPDILYFFLAQLLLHAAYCCLVWAVTKLVGSMLQLSPRTTFRLGISCWLLGIVTIIVANRYFFPNSKFSDLIAVHSVIIRVLFYVLFFCCCILLCLACLRLLYVGYLLVKRYLFLRRIIFMVGSFIVLWMWFYPKQPALPWHTPIFSNRPNVIIVGIDSLRPDFLGYFDGMKQTPFLDHFLHHATVFTEAFTPLARTFPSWVGILTGQYPKQNHIRSNLVDFKTLDLSASLPAILQHYGYETVFATDETRFSNIDQHFGFDKIIAPPMGLNDFLLGTFNDFPLSNLVINSLLGQWLFPHSYANRPVYFSYQPDSFLHLVARYLQHRADKPLFLAIHFCLPHYPYLWAQQVISENIAERYQAAIQRVDQQAQDFFVLLQNLHILDHAIVIVLSDHGEAIEFAGDRITDQELFIAGENNPVQQIPKFYPPSIDDETVNQSAGHGTDVLGLTQYHTLLAFRFYGMQQIPHRDVAGIVSLLDIKPTLLTFLHIPYNPVAGNALVEVIQAHKKPPSISLFLESDFSPAAIRTIYPETRQVVLEGIEFFHVDSATARLTVKPSMEKMIISSKQYAELQGEWVLALYPQQQGGYMPILVNLVTGAWTNDLQTPFAKASPALGMLQAIRHFYQDKTINLL